MLHLKFVFTLVALFLTDASKMVGGTRRQETDELVEWVNLIIMIIFFVELYLKR